MTDDFVWIGIGNYAEVGKVFLEPDVGNVADPELAGVREVLNLPKITWHFSRLLLKVCDRIWG